MRKRGSMKVYVGSAIVFTAITAMVLARILVFRDHHPKTDLLINLLNKLSAKRP